MMATTLFYLTSVSASFNFINLAKYFQVSFTMDFLKINYNPAYFVIIFIIYYYNIMTPFI